MRKKKLSQLPLEKCIYMSVGPHVGESLTEIMLRKEKEVEKCGWSLWAHAMKIFEKIPEFFATTEEVYVVFSPTGSEIKGAAKEAKYYYIDGENPTGIDPQMQVTYSSKMRSAYALVIEEYFEIDESDNVFHKGAYRTYETGAFQRGAYFLEKKETTGNRHDYKIPYVAKLKAPYNVIIK